VKIQGRIIADAAFFTARIRFGGAGGLVNLLADTGAAHTILVPRDAKALGVKLKALKQVEPFWGVGGSVRTSLMPDVEIAFRSDIGTYIAVHDLFVLQHDLDRMSSREISRVLSIPSILGRDLINRFRFIYDYQAHSVQMERS
jgi:hypothetical protein